MTFPPEKLRLIDMNRYQVLERSESGHSCCFDASVIDTARPCNIIPGRFYVMCECEDEENAELIAKLLNKAGGET